MNLQEFRTALETDATKRAEAQEQTIKELHDKVRGLETEMRVRVHALEADIAKRDQWIAQLERRCMVTSFGMLCGFCGYRSTCAARKKQEGD